MSTNIWRKITSTRVGTPDTYSAMDINDIMDLFNGVNTGKAVTINNLWSFVSGLTLTGANIADNSITDADIAPQTSTKITITDKTHLPADNTYATGSQTITGKTMDYNANTFQNFPFNPAGAGTGAPTSPNTYSALQTFRDMNFALRNAANTFSLTFKSPSVTSNLTFQFNSVYDYYVFIDPDDGLYKARDQRTGAIISTHATQAEVVINACITALPSTGGSIFIGSGTFSMVGVGGAVPTISISKPVNISGAGRGRTILMRNTVGKGQIISVISPADRTTLAHFTIDGNCVYPTFACNPTLSSTLTPASEIALNVLNSKVYDVEIKNTGCTGGSITNYGTAIVDSCVLYGANTANGYCPPNSTGGYAASISGTGVQGYPGGVVKIPITTVKNCDIQWFSSNAIAIYGRGIVDGCYLANTALNSGGAITHPFLASAGLTSSLSMIVSNNIVEHGLRSQSGFEVANADWTVTGNIVDGVENWGIAIEGLSTGPQNKHANIRGNIIKNCGIYGIGAISTNAYQYFIVEGNTVIDDGLGLTDNRSPQAMGVVSLSGSTLNLGAAYNTRVGERIFNSSSALNGKIIAHVEYTMIAVGSPTGTITCRIRKGTDDTEGSTLNTLDARFVSTTNTFGYSFVTPSIAYTTSPGDKISLEYSGGDASNYIQVSYDATGSFDGVNSDVFSYSGGTYSYLTGADMTGFWRARNAVASTQTYGIDVAVLAFDHYIIKDNILYGNTIAQLRDRGTGTNKKIIDNDGYNPVGIMTNPFVASGDGNISNLSQAAVRPASGTTQTVISTPKTITVTGGTVSSISINGSASVGTSGMWKLGIGETINITYSVGPTVSVFCG